MCNLAARCRGLILIEPLIAGPQGISFLHGKAGMIVLCLVTLFSNYIHAIDPEWYPGNTNFLYE